jgi:hypothetical protein
MVVATATYNVIGQDMPIVVASHGSRTLDDIGQDMPCTICTLRATSFHLLLRKLPFRHFRSRRRGQQSTSRRQLPRVTALDSVLRRMTRPEDPRC